MRIDRKRCSQSPCGSRRSSWSARQLDDLTGARCSPARSSSSRVRIHIVAACRLAGRWLGDRVTMHRLVPRELSAPVGAGANPGRRRTFVELSQLSRLGELKTMFSGWHDHSATPGALAGSLEPGSAVCTVCLYHFRGTWREAAERGRKVMSPSDTPMRAAQTPYFLGF